MIHLVSESFQTILFLFFFSLPLKLPRLSLFPSPLQHISPKLHPKGSTEGEDIRPELLLSLPLPLPRPTLPIAPDTAGLRAVEGFMGLPERSSSPIIGFYLFLSPPPAPPKPPMISVLIPAQFILTAKVNTIIWY